MNEKLVAKLYADIFDKGVRNGHLKNQVNALTNELRSETSKRKSLEKSVEIRGDAICEQLETNAILTERCEKFSAQIKELGAMVSELGNGHPGTVKEREWQLEECHKKIKRQADHIKCQDSKLTRLNKTAKNNSPWGRVVKDLKEKISQHENHIADQGAVVLELKDINRHLNEQIKLLDEKVESYGESITALIDGLKYTRRLVGHPKTATAQRILNHINMLMMARYK